MAVEKGVRARGRTGGWNALDIEKRLRRFYSIGKNLLLARNGQAPPSSAGPRGTSSPSGYSDSHLRDCCRFARAYTEPELEELLTMRRVDEMPLSWSIVRLLIAIPDKKKRKRYEAAAVRQSWSSRQMAEVLQKRVYRTKRSSGGHPFSVPRDLAGQIHQVGRENARLAQLFTAWSEQIDLYEREGRAKVTDQSIQLEVQEVCELLLTISGRARSLRRRLSNLIGPDALSSTKVAKGPRPEK